MPKAERNPGTQAPQWIVCNASWTAPSSISSTMCARRKQEKPHSIRSVHYFRNDENSIPKQVFRRRHMVQLAVRKESSIIAYFRPQFERL